MDDRNLSFYDFRLSSAISSCGMFMICPKEGLGDFRGSNDPTKGFEVSSGEINVFGSPLAYKVI